MRKVNTPFRVDPGGQHAQAQKHALRSDLLKRRRVMDTDLKSTTQWKAINHLRTLYSEVGPCVVAVYAPIQGEINLMPWVQELWQQGATVMLPRVVERGHPLVFNMWTPDDPMDRDRLGMVCATGVELMPAMMVIPCVGYNRQGYRLGYGGGYYDMTLKMMDLPAITVGVAYTALEVPDFPSQYHDQRLQYFVTGKEVICC